MNKPNINFDELKTFFIYPGDCMDLLKVIPDQSVDLILTSPPYCMGKAYENIKDDIETFKQQQQRIADDIYRILKFGGSLCWQVGYHVSNAEVIPLDFYVYDIFRNCHKDEVPLILRNRIIWTFGHGLNSIKRFSGRHETILWFTKGDTYNFNLDCVRVPQKYPGKRAYKGLHKGELSGNPLGKNPSDIWDIPNVKANHIEKTEHPCQFPIAIPQRLIRALTNEGDIVLDPFMGVGSTGVACMLEKRKFIGSEIQEQYYEIANDRLSKAVNGELKYREDAPVFIPDERTSVAKLPEEFKIARTKRSKK